MGGSGIYRARRHDRLRSKDPRRHDVRLRSLNRSARKYREPPRKPHVENVPPGVINDAGTKGAQQRNDIDINARHELRVEVGHMNPERSPASRHEHPAAFERDPIGNARNVRCDRRPDVPTEQIRVVVGLQWTAVEQNRHWNRAGWEYHALGAIYRVR